MRPCIVTLAYFCRPPLVAHDLVAPCAILLQGIVRFFLLVVCSSSPLEALLFLDDVVDCCLEDLPLPGLEPVSTDEPPLLFFDETPLLFLLAPSPIERSVNPIKCMPCWPFRT